MSEQGPRTARPNGARTDLEASREALRSVLNFPAPPEPPAWAPAVRPAAPQTGQTRTTPPPDTDVEAGQRPARQVPAVAPELREALDEMANVAARVESRLTEIVSSFEVRFAECLPAFAPNTDARVSVLAAELAAMRAAVHELTDMVSRRDDGGRVVEELVGLRREITEFAAARPREAPDQVDMLGAEMGRTHDRLEEVVREVAGLRGDYRRVAGSVAEVLDEMRDGRKAIDALAGEVAECRAAVRNGAPGAEMVGRLGDAVGALERVARGIGDDASARLEAATLARMADEFVELRTQQVSAVYGEMRRLLQRIADTLHA